MRERRRLETVTLSHVNVIVRPPWLVVLGSAVCITLIAASPGYLHTNGLLDPLLYGGSLGGSAAVGLGQRSVTVMDGGLWIKRSYFDRFFCQWSEVVAVERRQLGPFAVDQLRLREPVRKFFRGNPTGPPDVTWQPIPSKKIFIGLYDRHWRKGPIGAAMTEHGVSLEAITPNRG